MKKLIAVSLLGLACLVPTRAQASIACVTNVVLAVYPSTNFTYSVGWNPLCVPQHISGVPVWEGGCVLSTSCYATDGLVLFISRTNPNDCSSLFVGSISISCSTAANNPHIMPITLPAGAQSRTVYFSDTCGSGQCSVYLCATDMLCSAPSE